jgi:hypothetical protein
MDIERLIDKYTGQPVTWDALLAAANTGDTERALLRTLAGAVERAAYAVGDTEAELVRVTDSIGRSLARVHANIDATAGQLVPAVNPLGELQANAPRFDAQISLRDERIAHLAVVTRLWQTATQTAPPNSTDIGQALTDLGLQPIKPAHATTSAAYGHRHGDQQLDVSVNPYGDGGVEVNASTSASTVAWTATFGPDTPTVVVLAAVRAAIHLPSHVQAHPRPPASPVAGPVGANSDPG